MFKVLWVVSSALCPLFWPDPHKFICGNCKQPLHMSTNIMNDGIREGVLKESETGLFQTIPTNRIPDFSSHFPRRITLNKTEQRVKIEISVLELVTGKAIPSTTLVNSCCWSFWRQNYMLTMLTVYFMYSYSRRWFYSSGKQVVLKLCEYTLLYSLSFVLFLLSLILIPIAIIIYDIFTYKFQPTYKELRHEQDTSI